MSNDLWLPAVQGLIPLDFFILTRYRWSCACSNDSNFSKDFIHARAMHMWILGHAHRSWHLAPPAEPAVEIRSIVLQKLLLSRWLTWLWKFGTVFKLIAVLDWSDVATHDLRSLRLDLLIISTIVLQSRAFTFHSHLSWPHNRAFFWATNSLCFRQ